MYARAQLVLTCAAALVLGGCIVERCEVRDMYEPPTTFEAPAMVEDAGDRADGAEDPE